MITHFTIRFYKVNIVKLQWFSILKTCFELGNGQMCTSGIYIHCLVNVIYLYFMLICLLWQVGYTLTIAFSYVNNWISFEFIGKILCILFNFKTCKVGIVCVCACVGSLTLNMITCQKAVEIRTEKGSTNYFLFPLLIHIGSGLIDIFWAIECFFLINNVYWFWICIVTPW